MNFILRRGLRFMSSWCIGMAAPAICLCQDSLHVQPTQPDSGVSVARGESATALILTVDELADFDHEEFGDWIAVMPGFYPLDRAGFASAYRGQILGLSPQTVNLCFRGRPIEDHLTGAVELGWVPPEALARMEFQPLSLETAGARIDAALRSLEASPPSSRVAVRDGYYGLGTVDFDLAQMIAPSVVLNGGGRVAQFNGRLPHSEGYGLNLRTEISFQASGELSGWSGLMQNRLNSQVPFSSISHNRERYDGDVVLQWKSIGGHLYGLQQRETFGGGEADGWDELGLMSNWARQTGAFRTEMTGRISAARWRLKGYSWSSTTFGNVGGRLEREFLGHVKSEVFGEIDLSDDYAPARHLGLRIEAPLDAPVGFFAGADQNQRTPSRYESWADFQPGMHDLPYDPALYQYPSLDVVGTRGLKNETSTMTFIGGQIRSGLASATLAGFWRRSDDVISWHVENGTLRSYNAPSEEQRGALGWAQIYPRRGLELGLTGSFLPLKSGEHRLFPEAMAHAWAQYGHKFFQNELEMRLRVWEDLWGKRQAPIPGGWESLGEAYVLSARISAYLLGVHLFWEVTNILHRNYELFPGYPMMHKEEVWGIAWNFRN